MNDEMRIRHNMCRKIQNRPGTGDGENRMELTIKGGQLGLKAAVERLAHVFVLLLLFGRSKVRGLQVRGLVLAFLLRCAFLVGGGGDGLQTDDGSRASRFGWLRRQHQHPAHQHCVPFPRRQSMPAAARSAAAAEPAERRALNSDLVSGRPLQDTIL